MNDLGIAILLAYIAIQVFGYCMEYLNILHMRKHLGVVPPDFQGFVDEALLARMFEYGREKMRFDILASSFSSVMLVIFLFGGLLRCYAAWIGNLGLSFLAAGWLFFLLLYVAGELLSIPFSLFFVFRIEHKYGFNAMTPRLWIIDFLKTTSLSTVLLSIVILGGLAIISWSPDFWWFWFWCLMLVCAIFVTYISPYVIEPLFNTFTPVEDPSLKDRIVEMASRAGIRVNRVLKMDASKRSRRTNAYFTGIGRTKRIVLFDTLLEKMESSEIMAVLAHEIGHWKRRHLLKGLAVTELATLVFLYLAYHALQSDALAALFGIPGDALFAKIVIVGFLFSMLSFFLKPLACGFSRKLEREADRFSCDFEGDAEAMVRVMVKLTKDNLANFYPHPLYAALNYSHPPALERIRYIREYCRRESAR